MNISVFLTERLQWDVPEQTRAALDRLAGKNVRFTRFYADIEESEKWTLPWMPLYFLPIAKEDIHWYGFHLTPQNRAAGRLPIVKAADNPISERVSIAEVAPTLERYLYRVMLEWEADFYDDASVPPEDRPLEEELEESLPFLREVFGAGFYQPGRREFYVYDEKYKEYFFDAPGDIMIRHFGGSSFDYLEKLWSPGDKELMDKFEAAEEGSRKFPDCFALNFTLARICQQKSDVTSAARSVDNAIACYHHTAYDNHPQKAYELGRELLTQSPDAFTPFAREALTERGDVGRMKWIVSHVAKGEVERTVKLLDDLCFDWRQYETPYVLDFFKRLFVHLDWEWAIALCDLRYPSEKLRQRLYSSAQAEAWNEMVRKITGLE